MNLIPLKNFRILILLMIIIAQIPAFIGCAIAPVTEAPPPKAVHDIQSVSSIDYKTAAESEKSDAKASMDNALSFGADKYAEADMNAAKKFWDAAEAKMKDEKYTGAKKDYAAAKIAFDKAAGNAEEGRKTAAAEANAAIANLEKAWVNIRAAYGNVKNKMKDQEMKSAWSAFTKSFPEDLKASKGKIDSDPAGAKANIDELMAIIERWETAFKELSAVPSKQKETKTKTKPTKTTKK